MLVQLAPTNSKGIQSSKSYFNDCPKVESQNKMIFLTVKQITITSGQIEIPYDKIY